MPDEIILRDATPDDAAAIAEIYNESIRAGDASMDVVPKTASDIRRYMAGFGEREGYLVLVDEAGGTLGWGVVKRYGCGAFYRDTCETSVYLRRAEVRKGYGARLQQALLDRCRAYGYHHIVARIWASNAGSIAFHERFGYELVGIQREIGHVRGQWQDVAVMQRVFDVRS